MSATAVSSAKFSLGHLVATPNALSRLAIKDVLAGIIRHQAGDWGDLGKDDRLENDLSLEKGSRLLSAYTASNGVRFWIITEGDRSRTTVLLPEDY
jgi:hypothetical protein